MVTLTDNFWRESGLVLPAWHSIQEETNITLRPSQAQADFYFLTPPATTHPHHTSQSVRQAGRHSDEIYICRTMTVAVAVAVFMYLLGFVIQRHNQLCYCQLYTNIVQPGGGGLETWTCTLGLPDSGRAWPAGRPRVRREKRRGRGSMIMCGL